MKILGAKCKETLKWGKFCNSWTLEGSFCKIRKLFKLAYDLPLHILSLSFSLFLSFPIPCCQPLLFTVEPRHPLPFPLPHLSSSFPLLDLLSLWILLFLSLRHNRGLCLIIYLTSISLHMLAGKTQRWPKPLAIAPWWPRLDDGVDNQRV